LQHDLGQIKKKWKKTTTSAFSLLQNRASFMYRVACVNCTEGL
jgi:hypothetical protein